MPTTKENFFPSEERCEIVLCSNNAEWWDCTLDLTSWRLFLRPTSPGEEPECVGEGESPTKEAADIAAMQAYLKWKEETDEE